MEVFDVGLAVAFFDFVVMLMCFLLATVNITVIVNWSDIYIYVCIVTIAIIYDNNMRTSICMRQNETAFEENFSQLLIPLSKEVQLTQIGYTVVPRLRITSQNIIAMVALAFLPPLAVANSEIKILQITVIQHYELRVEGYHRIQIQMSQWQV